MSDIKVLSNGIIQVTNNQELVDKAKKIIANNFVVNPRSVLKGQGNFQGAMGEVIFNYVFPDAEKVESYDYDFYWQSRKIEIKTKSANTLPTDNMDISIPVYSLEKQQCDSYVFVRILNDFTIAWILGGITKQAYIERSTLYKKGFTDYNGYTFLWDARILKIGNLRRLSEYYNPKGEQNDG